MFVDTGYLIALEDMADENHLAAQEHWASFRERSFLLTSSYVLDEVVTFFNVRGKHDKAHELGQTLLLSPSMTLIHVDETLLRRGFALLSERQDKRYSLTDCVSFVVMQERGMSIAFTFDRHFVQEGFVKLPHQH